MNKRLLASTLASAAVVTASPISAAVLIDFNNVMTAENVLYTSSTSVAAPSLVAFTNQTNTAVTFANVLGLIADASGQSSTKNANGSLIGTTSATIASGFTFNVAQFNIPGIPGNPPPPEASSVFVEALSGAAVIGSATLNITGNGENRIRIAATNSETFTGFRITLSPAGAGVQSLTQVRLGGVAPLAPPVPEPATWAMLFGGFGFAGVALRHRQRTAISYS